MKEYIKPHGNSARNPEAVYKIEMAIRKGSTLKEAAASVPITYRTLYNWFKADPEWADYCSSIEGIDLMADSRESVHQGVKTDPNLALKVLEKLDPRYAKKQINVNKGESALPTIEFSQLSIEDVNTGEEYNTVQALRETDASDGGPEGSI